MGSKEAKISGNNPKEDGGQGEAVANYSVEEMYGIVNKRKEWAKKKLEAEEALTGAGGTEKDRPAAEATLKAMEDALSSSAEKLQQSLDALLKQGENPNQLSKISASIKNPDLSTWLVPPPPEPNSEKVKQYWPGSKYWSGPSKG